MALRGVWGAVRGAEPGEGLRGQVYGAEGEGGVSQHHKRMTGYARQKRNRALLARSDVCHICGHPGSDAIDHVIPLAKGGSDDDLDNLKPAHHDVPCPDCGERCNRSKGSRLMAPIVKRSGSLRRP